MVRTPTAAILASLLFAACTADPGGPEVGDVDAGGPDIPGEVELSVAGVPPTTVYSSIPISGSGPSGGELLYDSPAGGHASTRLGADGSFCIDVDLIPGTQNKIKFEAVDQEGNYSAATVVEVRQEGEPPAPVEPTTPDPTYVNIAKDSSGFEMNLSVVEGTPEVLVDGDKSNFATFRHPFSRVEGWMSIELSDGQAPIQEIRIKTPADCPLEEYNVLLTSTDNGEPVTKLSGNPLNGFTQYGDGWVIVSHVSKGSADQIILPKLNNPSAVRLGLEFLSDDCRPFNQARALHKISEIEVWAARPGEEPVDRPRDGAPSCATGG